MTGLTSAVLLVIVMLIVYGVFKRSTRVEDAERFIHPQGDGTWRDWLQRAGRLVDHWTHPSTNWWKHFTSTSTHNKGKWGQHSYAVLELLACAAGLREPVTMVTRLRLDVALYDPAPERKAPECLLDSRSCNSHDPFIVSMKHRGKFLSSYRAG
jgi:hypothetical protein